MRILQASAIRQMEILGGGPGSGRKPGNSYQGATMLQQHGYKTTGKPDDFGEQMYHHPAGHSMMVHPNGSWMHSAKTDSSRTYSSGNGVQSMGQFLHKFHNA